MKKDSSHNKVNQYISDKTKTLREQSGLSQKELSKKFADPISPQQMQKYESGVNQMSAARLYEMCQIFNFDIGDFFKDYKSTKKEAISSEEIIALRQFFIKLKSCDASDDFLKLIKKI